MTKRLLGLLNRLTHVAGLELVPQWRLVAPTFTYKGKRLEGYCHTYNCGFPPRLMTERAVELPIADRWLSALKEPPVEVGAVTPYYWPGRVHEVIDPFDTHPLVTMRSSVLAADLRGRDVLAISTLEHIGLDEYGIGQSSESSRDAFRKIIGESRSCLITVPFGYAPEPDLWAFSEPMPAGVTQTILVRRGDSNEWIEFDGRGSLTPYVRGWFANAIAVIEKATVRSA